MIHLDETSNPQILHVLYSYLPEITGYYEHTAVMSSLQLCTKTHLLFTCVINVALWTMKIIAQDQKLLTCCSINTPIFSNFHCSSIRGAEMRNFMVRRVA
jgi:hypothetical protein